MTVTEPDLDAAIAGFHRDGFARVGAALDRAGAAALAARADDLMMLSSTVGSEAWNSRDLKSRPH